MKSIQALMVACALVGTGALAQDKEADMRGITVSVGGGVEGYSGGLAPRIDPGAAFGATVGIRPSRVLGLELGYSGAVNSLDLDGAEDLLGNPDIVRNGAQAVATFGITATPVQPYVLGGIGVSDYNVRQGGEALGYSDDTVGSVPLGAGLRFHSGDFSADFRANYNVLFDEEIAPESAVANVDPEDVNFAGGGSYNATLNVGFIF
ncbi:outer membrane beta-barrel protein [Myxococcus sp. RHSTA-1-4]|uniref:outer membrane beta-barrel protein n=1 Tax=Myxococcus sp. RHSTA-1-4 TaxID=2874601 RepID=UPI001CC17F63|nr:outer membrane beta-barrel protein [Myxococcus sp. RHSTA-1-4]MBZ4422880.1 outer membrane beta-barrel protein [Myxococcus sp. RHSTA-1-4]